MGWNNLPGFEAASPDMSQANTRVKISPAKSTLHESGPDFSHIFNGGSGTAARPRSASVGAEFPIVAANPQTTFRLI
jgi:hypothetical protein